MNYCYKSKDNPERNIVDKNRCKGSLNATNLYFKSLEKCVPMNKEEELYLCTEYKRTKDKSIRDKIVSANLRLVVSVAKKYFVRAEEKGIMIEDLFGYGNIGLMKAVDKFDPGLGYKLSTYAVYWIRQSIMRNISLNEGNIRVPNHINEQIKTLNKVSHQLREFGIEKPTNKQLAEKSKMSVDKVNLLKNVMDYDLIPSLNQQAGNNVELHELVECKDKTHFDPDRISENYFLKKTLDKAFKNLTTRQIKVLEYRFGLDGNDALTLEKVGEKLGVTRERIRQIEKLALEKLRRLRHTRQILEDFVD